MKISKSYDNLRKKGSKKEVKIQVFVRIRPPLQDEIIEKAIPIQMMDNHLIKSKYILNNF